ncbi:MAG: transposase [Minisyncoccota bacterium]
MELYHVLNRGVDKRHIFLDSQDYARFVHNLYEFNDIAPAQAYCRRLPNVGPRRSYIRKRLVDIHGWVLMRNHYHLLLSELVEGGITRFLVKLNVGYAKYFNERHTRDGTLFQGRTKKILVKDESHFLYLLHYVHLNPLDYLAGAFMWRERDKGTIKDAGEALKYLNEYRWSSYLDYCGRKNFPSLITKDLFGNTFDNYQKTIEEYLESIDTSLIAGLALE